MRKVLTVFIEVFSTIFFPGTKIIQFSIFVKTFFVAGEFDVLRWPSIR